MGIDEKVKQIEILFDQLEKEISVFKSETNLHCLTGCGKCCSKPDIDASPLEFLPWAFDLFLNVKAEETLLKLNNSSISICHFFKPFSLLEEHKGSCTNYPYRGLICRLFGYAANKNKYGELHLATCKIIKEDQQENFKNTGEAIRKGLYVPVFSDYYMQLAQIDFKMGTTMLPINKAMKMAIEEVLQYYAYRPFPN